MAYTAESFLKKLRPLAVADMKRTGILASLTGSQGFLESNKGNSGLSTQCNNLFGIKGTYNGQSGRYLTTEYVNGVATKVYANFRKYPSWFESVNDHSAFLNKYARYKKLRGCTDYKLAAQYIGESGYATSPTYAQTVLSYMTKYKLYEWDNLVLHPTNPTAIGQYQTISRLFVRCEPNKNSAQVPKSALTANAQANSDENGILNLGISVTVKKIAYDGYGNTWGQIPSGWIALRYNNVNYVIQ